MLSSSTFLFPPSASYLPFPTPSISYLPLILPSFCLISLFFSNSLSLLSSPHLHPPFFLSLSTSFFIFPQLPSLPFPASLSLHFSLPFIPYPFTHISSFLLPSPFPFPSLPPRTPPSAPPHLSSPQQHVISATSHSTPPPLPHRH